MKELKFDMWMNILIYLAENTTNNISSITQGLRSSYAHTFNLCNTLEEAKLITMNKEGRLINIELTTHGWSAAKHIKELKQVLEEAKQNGEQRNI